MVNCATIPAGEAFAKRLAGWLLKEYGGDVSGLAGVLVLLPNRRAGLALRQAFLECTAGKPLILPRIQPLGDIEQEEILWGEAAELPAAMPQLRRQLLLMQLIMRLEKTRGDHAPGPKQVAELAAQLARFIDDAAREEINLDKLSLLVPEEFAAHWQHTLDFLKLVSHHWPLVLEKERLLDPATRRYHQLKAIAESWKRSPPPYPVVAAGSTGSHPATAALLSTIARLPHGMVVLPGLDADMPENEWELIAETHPQYGLKQLLERMDIERNSVQPLGDLRSTLHAPRIHCLRAVFEPPEITASWAKTVMPLADGFRQVQVTQADTPADEARLIAIALRETLETPGKTAALVTPDRTLARMTAEQLRRFGIAIDDSAGRPLADTPPGCFLRLSIEMVASGVSPSELLAGLRHPLAAAGRAPAECRALSRLLEIELLRGVRHAPGLKALHDSAGDTAVKRLLADLEKYLRPLAKLFARRKPVALKSLLEEHVAFAEWLASTGEEPGEDHLWKGDAGRDLASFIAELLEHADSLPPVEPESYPGLLEALLAGKHWWPRYGLHPRLHILSPMEARLQHYDKVILAGLSEGAWPKQPDANPWMSRPMRRAMGLPMPERETGQSAHDFFMLAAMPEVLLTRARKSEGTPTVPSRWLVRLKTFVEGRDAALWKTMDASAHYAHALAELDAPVAMKPLSPPAPTPPLAARPRKMGVTAIDTWLADPYAIYARYILKLKALDPLDQDPGAADFGIMVHRALEMFTARWPAALPGDAYENLLECGREAFAKFLGRPAVAALWWPRFEEVARWIVETETLRRKLLQNVLGEIQGEWKIETEGGEFLLTARIDRLETGKDGAVTIADYKTGVLPKDSMQLPLAALVAMNEKLTPTLTLPLKGGGNIKLEYWKLGGNAQKCEIKSVDASPEETRERLMALIRRFDNSEEPYAAQTDRRLQLAHNDFEHLTRRQEWETV